MGYNLYIIRSDYWPTAGEQPGRITLAEWRRLAEADPQFEPTEGGENYIWRPSDWTFCYFPGRVWVKSPDDQTIGKMLRVACELNARVQGESGEFYRLTESGYESYQDESEDTG